MQGCNLACGCSFEVNLEFSVHRLQVKQKMASKWIWISWENNNNFQKLWSIFSWGEKSFCNEASLMYINTFVHYRFFLENWSNLALVGGTLWETNAYRWWRTSFFRGFWVNVPLNSAWSHQKFVLTLREKNWSNFWLSKMMQSVIITGIAERFSEKCLIIFVEFWLIFGL